MAAGGLYQERAVMEVVEAVQRLMNSEMRLNLAVVPGLESFLNTCYLPPEAQELLEVLRRGGDRAAAQLVSYCEERLKAGHLGQGDRNSHEDEVGALLVLLYDANEAYALLLARICQTYGLGWMAGAAARLVIQTCETGEMIQAEQRGA